MSRFAECLAVVQAAPIASAALRIKTHRAYLPSGVCCPDRQAGTECTPRAPETSFRPMDMHGLRRAFPDRWGEFCRRHFQDAEHLAAFMDVDVRTARYWLEGKHAPAAPFVLRAITAFPDAIPCLSDGDC